VTVSRSDRFGDLVGIRVSGGSSEFPDLATKQTVSFGSLDPHRVVTMLRAADAAAFFTREELRSGSTEPDVRTWHVRLCHGGRARLLAFMEPVPDPALAVLIRLARDCLSARHTMGIEDVSHTLRDAVAASRAPLKSATFNYEVELVADRQNEQSGDGIVCGVSGCFTPPTVCDTAKMSGRCRRSRRRTGQRCSIMPTRSTFPDAPNRRQRDHPTVSLISLSRPETESASLRSTTSSRPEFIHLITLNRRAARDCQVLSLDMLDNVQFAALAAAWLDARSATSGNDPNR